MFVEVKPLILALCVCWFALNSTAGAVVEHTNTLAQHETRDGAESRFAIITDSVQLSNGIAFTVTSNVHISENPDSNNPGVDTAGSDFSIPGVSDIQAISTLQEASTNSAVYCHALKRDVV